MALVCAAALTAAWGCGVRPCRPGTALLTLELPGALAEADTFDLLVTVDGVTRTFHRERNPPGAATLELDFKRDYPAGSQLAVGVVASRGGTRLGAASTQLALSPGCTPLTLTLTPDPSSIGGSQDGGQVDGQAVGDGAVGVGCASIGIACQDFEKEVTSPWTLEQNSGGAERSQDRPPRGGSFAAKLTVGANGSDCSAEVAYRGLPKASELWVRAYLLAETKAPTTGTILTLWQQAAGAGVWIETDAAGSLILASTAASPVPTAATLATHTWVCLELQLTYASRSKATMFIEGRDAMSIDLDNLPTLTELYVGPSFSTPQEGWSLWVDDIAIDYTRIGCAR